jgi:tetratricopeptide (TPR) repeat protein
MMMFRHVFLCCTMLVVSTASLHAEALVKPLPAIDSSKLAPDVAKQLADARAEFDRAKVNLVGDALAAAYAQMGAQYFRARQDAAADIAFYDAAELAPEDGRWPYLRGVVATAQKRPADARANFEAALALDRSYPPIRYRLADVLISLGDLDGAHKLLEDIVKDYPDVAVAAAMLGRLELRQGRNADAVTHLQAALKLEPQANALYRDLADAYTAQGNAQLAKESLAKAGSTQPVLADPLVAGLSGAAPAAVHGTPLEQAQQLLAQHRFDEARAKLDVALKDKADDAEALALAARVDALLGKQTAAREEAARGLKLQPDAASTNLSQGMVYEFGGDDANAQMYYERATRADPDQPDAQLLLGNVLMRRGEYVQAAERYRRLAALSPRNDNADARVAAAQVAGGRCADALAEINTALRKRAQDGDLLQIFVRVASTCPAASAQERSMALDYAQTLYKQRPNAPQSSALALAQAAAGKFDEAQKSQAEAVFEAVRAGDSELAAMYRETMRQFVAKQVPDRPWPAEHPYFKPMRLTPLPPADTAAKGR